MFPAFLCGCKITETPSVDRGDQNRCLNPNHDAFLTLIKWFLCLPKQRMSSVETREKYEHQRKQT